MTLDTLWDEDSDILPRLLQQPQPQPRRPPQARETQTEDADFPANRPFLAPDPQGPGAVEWLQGRRAPSRHARLRQAASAGGAPAGGLRAPPLSY